MLKTPFGLLWFTFTNFYFYGDLLHRHSYLPKIVGELFLAIIIYLTNNTNLLLNFLYCLWWRIVFFYYLFCLLFYFLYKRQNMKFGFSLLMLIYLILSTDVVRSGQRTGWENYFSNAIWKNCVVGVHWSRLLRIFMTNVIYLECRRFGYNLTKASQVSSDRRIFSKLIQIHPNLSLGGGINTTLRNKTIICIKRITISYLHFNIGKSTCRTCI